MLLLRTAARLASAAGLSSQWRWRYREVGADYGRRYKSAVAASRQERVCFTRTEMIKLGMDTAPASERENDTGTESGGLDEVLRLDLQDYMPGDILVKVDRASMSHGLELRAPFLDVELASFCVALPSILKINTEADKLVLRQAFAQDWPEAIRTRGKQGFGAPVGKWLAQPAVQSLKARYLDDRRQKMFEVLSFLPVRQVVQKDNYQTWILLNLALWMDKHDFGIKPRRGSQVARDTMHNRHK
jgi:asparagine synthase (glutamine-hydrolysing)